MTGIGLIGSGGMAGVYANRISRHPDASITAVASPNTADQFVADHVPDATAYDSAAALCGDPSVDAVAILTPTHTHRNLVETAADHGRDVICEKPLARSMAGAHAIRDAVDDAGITFLTAHVVRFFPEYAKAKEQVDAGEIGSPGVARTKRAFGFEGARGWFDDHDKSGGVLLDLAIHDFDFLRWTLGEVDEVFARHTEWTGDGRNEVSLTLLRFENGSVGHVEGWWVDVPSIPFSTAFELAGDEGLIEFDVDDVQPIREFGPDGVHVPRDPVGDDLPLVADGYYRQLDHFIECVTGEAEPLITVEDGISAMRLSLAAIESADRGIPVDPATIGA